jgi:NAD(P)-dependent dehydrogenase (short-subunit alcohol dehydrogenase family)
MDLLEDRTAVITGGARGLGFAIAERFVAEGARVVIGDIDLDAARESVAELGEENAIAVRCDVTSEEDMAALVNTALTRLNGLDVMVNNAGVLRDATMRKMTLDDFRMVIDTHLNGTWLGTRAAAAVMREQGSGSIVNMSSISGKVGNLGQTNYSAAKAGIVAFARTWATELARAKVTVNAIVPTAWTQMTASIPIYEPLIGRDEFPPEVRREHALGRPEDCAPLVVYLASEAAAGVTGQAIGIGGDRLSLYSHPTEIEHELRDGGWTADTIAEAIDSFPVQPYGVRLPELHLS